MPLVGGVVVTHGNLATELVSAAETIINEDIHHVTAISIGWHDDVETAREQIGKAIERVNQGAGVVVLTDMFGGTPTNLACTFLGNAPIEVVTGVNLPMLLRLAEQQPDEALAVIARRVRDQGQKTIYLASEVLAPTKQPPGQTNGKE
ncbi:MAG TPA: PTS sugar transporter subunit IIA [Blastocatellia bacterium]|nr:PTS sugar transporter subunit IIA [Blastocatellia bacterium]